MRDKYTIDKIYESEIIIFINKNKRLEVSLPEDTYDDFEKTMENVLSTLFMKEFTTESKALDSITKLEFEKIISNFIKTRQLKRINN